MPKCKVCGSRMTAGQTKCPACGVDSTVPLHSLQPKPAASPAAVADRRPVRREPVAPVVVRQPARPVLAPVPVPVRRVSEEPQKVVPVAERRTVAEVPAPLPVPVQHIEVRKVEPEPEPEPEMDLLEQGYAYIFGDGCKKDETKAYQCFKRALDEGNEDAHFPVGICCLEGLGRSEDEHKAFKHFKKAHKNGDADGTAFLGLCYANGIGVEQDYERGYDLICEAKEDGSKWGKKFKKKLPKPDIQYPVYYNQPQSNDRGYEALGALLGMGMGFLIGMTNEDYY